MIFSTALTCALSSMVEQRTHNPLVAGSNPAGRTIFWGRSSVGRASRSQRGCRGFKSHRLHQMLQGRQFSLAAFLISRYNDLEVLV